MTDDDSSATSTFSVPTRSRAGTPGNVVSAAYSTSDSTFSSRRKGGERKTGKTDCVVNSDEFEPGKS
jgi:hypothetical protein